MSRHLVLHAAESSVLISTCDHAHAPLLDLPELGGRRICFHNAPI